MCLLRILLTNGDLGVSSGHVRKVNWALSLALLVWAYTAGWGVLVVGGWVVGSRVWGWVNKITDFFWLCSACFFWGESVKPEEHERWEYRDFV